MQNRCVAILLMGGSGERFDPHEPKQFALYKNKPLFLHSAKTLASQIDEIVYVIRERDRDLVMGLLKQEGLLRPTDHFVVGGEFRQESVCNAIRFLKAYDPKTIVLIHDANRPWVEEDDIEGVIETAKKKGAAILAAPATDSICVSETGNRVDHYVDRNIIYQVQTPQAFTLEILLEAFPRADGIYTDEGSLVQVTLGINPAIVLGHPSNRKITTREDLQGE